RRCVRLERSPERHRADALRCWQGRLIESGALFEEKAIAAVGDELARRAGAERFVGFDLPDWLPRRDAEADRPQRKFLLNEKRHRRRRSLLHADNRHAPVGEQRAASSEQENRQDQNTGPARRSLLAHFNVYKNAVMSRLSSGVTLRLGIVFCGSMLCGFCSHFIIVSGLLGYFPAMVVCAAMLSRGGHTDSRGPGIAGI